MLPILLDLGIIKIYTQGVFLVLAFFWSSFMLWKHVTLTSYNEEDVFDVIFMSLFGGILVGRIVHVSLNFADFGFNLLKFILVNGYPGIDGLGAIIGFFIFLFFLSVWKKIDFKKFIDYLVSPLLLAIAITKLGSFFSGSEIGTQTNFFLSLKYPSLDGMRHLTALYESILYFIGSIIAHRILMEIRREKLSEGFNFWYFIWYFSLVTFAFDPITSFKAAIGRVSVHLAVSAIMLLTVSTYFIYYFRKFLFRSLSLTKVLRKSK